MIRVADYIASFIYNIGVKDVFMVSGGLSMHLVDAVGRHEELKYVCCHHEQSATIAAEAYARKTNNLGVAYVTAGPGATNTLTGICGAWLDSAPVMVIAGQSKLSQVGIEGVRQFGVQGFDIVPMFEKVTKYAVTIIDPRSVRYHMEKAAYLVKNGRPGPVWIEVPLDIQGALVDENDLPGYDPEVDPDNKFMKEFVIDKSLDKYIQMIVELINNSKRPLLLAGNGVILANAVDDFNHLVKILNIPAITSRLGIDIMDSSNPLYVGRPGTYGNRPGNFAAQNCDLLISIGCRLAIPLIGHDYKEFAKNAKKVVIDIDKNELEKPTIEIDIPINYDAKVFIDKLINAASKIRLTGMSKEWNNRCRTWKEQYPATLPEYENDENGISSYYFTDKLSDLLDEKAVIVLDTGSCFHSVAQSYKVKKGQKFITTGGLSSMGYGVPAAIGACIANGRKNTICITGDGSFQMNLQELATIAYNKLPIKIFIFNNNGYLLIRNTQQTFFDGHYVGEGTSSGLMCPDSEKVSKVYDIKFVKITEVNGMEDKIKEVINSDDPTICEITTPEYELIIPKVASKKNSDGTMVSMPYDDMYPFLDREEYLKNITFLE